MASTAYRDLTADEIDAYDQDGVVCARQVYDPEWVARMAGAMDRSTLEPTLFGKKLSNPSKGMYSDLFRWKTDDDFRDFVYDSPSAALAQQVMQSKRINFVVDHLFVKEPGCEIPTVWHRDEPAWPVAGTQICSIWLPFDPVTTESSGLEVIAGSHRWPVHIPFEAETGQGADDNVAAVLSEIGWRPASEQMASIDLDGDLDVDQVMRAAFLHVHHFLEDEMAHVPMPGARGLANIPKHLSRFDVRRYEMEPGDALLFNHRTVHSSGGNRSDRQRRRALSTRWAGDDAVFAPSGGNLPLFWPHGLQPGDRFSGPLFPQVLPHPIPEEGRRRGAGPEPPQPELVVAHLRRLRSREEAVGHIRRLRLRPASVATGG